MVKNVLVLGASGMLGHKLAQVFLEKGYHVSGTLFRQDASVLSNFLGGNVTLYDNINVTDEAALASVFEAAKPDLVLNAVGIIKQRPDVEIAETAIAINSLLPHRLARLCREHQARLITYSTDCVFSDKSKSGPSLDGDLPNADDLYGRSKLLGEIDGQENVLTLRMSIVGHELFAPKTSLIEWICSQKGKKVQGFAKALYTGFTTLELAHLTENLAKNFTDMSGLWQISSEATSKYDLLALVNDVYALNLDIEKNTDFVCDRRLDSTTFQEKTGYVPPSWKDMINAQFADYQNRYNLSSTVSKKAG